MQAVLYVTSYRISISICRVHQLFYNFFAYFRYSYIIRVWLCLYGTVMGSFPSRRAADWCVCTMSLYIGASRRLIGTRAPIYRRVACNELIVLHCFTYINMHVNTTL